MKLIPSLDSNLALDLVRITEAAALAAARWVGRGDKNASDQAAVDAMRLLFNVVHMDGIVVIGEGEKDQAPMLYNGERLGTGNPPVVDVAVDPIDGTRLVARGEANALSVVAVVDRGAMFNPGPCMYMEKIATGREAGGSIDITAPIETNIKIVALAKRLAISEVTVMILDRPRHEEIVERVRKTGARVHLLSDGDVAGAITAARLGTGVDLLYGIGGTPEGVIAAAALKCLGGTIQGRLYPTQRRGTHGRLERRLRSRPRLDHRRSRQGRERLFRRDRNHRRGLAAGRSFLARRGDHRVDRHARGLRHRPPDPRRAQRRQAQADLWRGRLNSDVCSSQ